MPLVPVCQASSPGSLIFPGHEYSQALLPEYFKPYAPPSFQLPAHPADYRALTQMLWAATQRRTRRLPVLPVTLEVGKKKPNQ